MQKLDCLYFCHSSCPVDVIILYIFVYSYIDVHQCISASESLWKHKGRSLLSNWSDWSHQSPSTGSTRQPLGLAFSESLWQDRVYCILLCLYIYISLFPYTNIFYKSLTCIDVVCTAAVRKAPQTRVTPKKVTTYCEYIYIYTCMNVLLKLM